MKTRIVEDREHRGFNLIARFGQARLVARPDGRARLQGGSRAEQAEAREWISLFMHEAVLQVKHPEFRVQRLRTEPRLQLQAVGRPHA